MKKLALGALLFSVALAGGNSANAVEPQPPGHVEVVNIVPSCAPWDGQAYRMVFALPASAEFPNAQFAGSIWGKGLEALNAGTSFTIQGGDGLSSDGYGEASIIVPNEKDGLPAQSMNVIADLTYMSSGQAVDKKINFVEWTITVHMPSPSNIKYVFSLNPVFPQAQMFCG